MIERERKGDVLVLRLAHGKASALDLELLRAIAIAVREGAESDARALVVTGTGKIFCAGVDLHRLTSEGPEYIRDFLPALDEALLAPMLCPKPVVMAVNGHAIAGGGILAWTGDWRMMARGGGRIGIPELLVGVPFPVVPLEIARATLPDRVLRGLALRGELWPAEGALERSMVDELCEPEELLGKAVERAAEMGALHGPSFAATKRILVGRVLSRAAELQEQQQEVEGVWQHPETINAVKEYVARTLAR